MSEQVHADDLKPDATEGFKVGEKKTLDEYHELGKRSLPYLVFHCTNYW